MANRELLFEDSPAGHSVMLNLNLNDRGELIAESRDHGRVFDILACEALEKYAMAN